MSHPRVKSQEEVEQEAQNILQRTLRGIGNGFGVVDDAYMGFMRDKVLRLPQKGMLTEKDNMNEVRNTLGEALFQARPGATGVNPYYQGQIDNAGDRAAIFANRALHAGGLTAAGAGLYQLTGAIVNQFGGPADQQRQGELYM